MATQTGALLRFRPAPIRGPACPSPLDDLHPAQLVYAGFSPAPDGESGGGGITGAVGGVLVAAVIGIGAFALSRRPKTPRRPQRQVRRVHHKKARAKRR